jgi:hypothetical protein
MNTMFTGAGISVENYDALLIGWNSKAPLKDGVVFDGGGSVYCLQQAVAARNNMINAYSWVIDDAGYNCSVGVDENSPFDFSISPNPASTFLDVQLSNFIDAQITLTDATGRVLESQMIKNEEKVYTIDVSNYTSGIYFIEVKGEQIQTQKIVIR